MLTSDLRERIDVKTALNSEFLTESFEHDPQKFKQSNITRLKEFWSTV
jgi:hypothetical protein